MEVLQLLADVVGSVAGLVSGIVGLLFYLSERRKRIKDERDNKDQTDKE